MPESIASAYVQIVPSMQGIKSALSEQLGGAVDKPSKQAGAKAGGNITGFIKKAIAAAGIGAALKKVVGSALSEGAALQQSIGGIETLFGAGGAKNVQEYASAIGKSVSEAQGEFERLKASEDKMLSYADAAWKTAGLSANDYMQTSTSFAASLLSSLDGDTSAAADAANRAVIAMSDNANKMGVDMATIQQAYQGFARQEYRMLDSLKLGYGGTKTEMERLLADAQELTGVKYDISNLSDVYSAISAIQDKLGITGTTAKEATETFSGSLASLKAAAKNALGKLAIGADIGPSLQALTESAKTFLVGNFVPMVKSVFTELPTLARGAVDLLGELFTGFIADLPTFAGDLGRLAVSLVSGISSAMPGIMAALPEAISGVVRMIGVYAPQLLALGAQLISRLAEGFAQNLPVLLAAFTELLPTLISAITNNLPTLFTAALTILQALVQGIIDNLPVLLAAALPLILTLSQTLLDNVSAFIDAGIELLIGLVQGIMQALPTLIAYVPQIITNICNIINNNMPKLLKAGIQILWEIIKGLVAAIPDIIANIGNIITMIWAIIQAVNWIQLGGKIVTGLGNGLKSMFGNIKTWAKELLNKITGTIKGGLGNLKNIGKNLVQGLWNGISGSLQWIKDRLTGWIGNVVDFIKNLFHIGSPSKLMADEVGRWLPPGISLGIDANAYLVEDSFRKLAEGIDTEAAFTPVMGSLPEAAAGLGFANVPGGGTLRPDYPEEETRTDELLLQIAELLAAFFRAWQAGGGDPEAFLRFIDRRLGRAAALKTRGV